MVDLLNIPYPDFQNLQIIDPEKFDLNNQFIVDKTNEIVNDNARHYSALGSEHDIRYYTKTEIDGACVKLTGDQNIFGAKTFLTPISVQEPINNEHATNKTFVATSINNSILAHEIDWDAHASDKITFNKNGTSLTSSDVYGAIREISQKYDTVNGLSTNVELVSARSSTLFDTTYNTLDDRLEAFENYSVTNITTIASSGSSTNGMLLSHMSSSASTSEWGHIALADNATILANVNTSRAVSPAGLHYKFMDYGSIVSKSASFSITQAERDKYITMTGSSAQVVTIQTYATSPVSIRGTIIFEMSGTGSVTFAPSGGVTLRSKDSKRTIDGQYSLVTLTQVSQDVWTLAGSLKA